jgi:hypothetical protein
MKHFFCGQTPEGHVPFTVVGLSPLRHQRQGESSPIHPWPRWSRVFCLGCQLQAGLGVFEHGVSQVPQLWSAGRKCQGIPEGGFQEVSRGGEGGGRGVITQRSMAAISS